MINLLKRDMAWYLRSASRIASWLLADTRPYPFFTRRITNIVQCYLFVLFWYLCGLLSIVDGVLGACWSFLWLFVSRMFTGPIC